MKVIIVGGGQVGYELAEQLSEQAQDVVLIEADAERAELIGDRLDVMTVVGNGASIPVLEEAGVRGAGLFLAVTNLDEVNILGCLAADRLRVKQKIARISNPEFYTRGSILSHEQLGIDRMINPELECARETLALLGSEGASEIVKFADGEAYLVGLTVRKGAPVANRTIAGLDQFLPGRHYTTVAIERDGRTEVPTGASRIEAGDRIYLVSPAAELEDLPALAGYPLQRLKRVMIAGGSREARYLSEMLADEGVQATIIEKDRKRCVELSSRLPKALILHGDATDSELLDMEGVSGVDGFVAYTDQDETNMLASLLATASGARKVVSLIHRKQYLPLASRVGIDATVSPRRSAVNTILRYLHRSAVARWVALREIDAEAIEVNIVPGANAIGTPIRDLGIPVGGVVGAIVRKGKLIPPRGDHAVEEGDRVVLFAKQDIMAELEKIFT